MVRIMMLFRVPPSPKKLSNIFDCRGRPTCPKVPAQSRGRSMSAYIIHVNLAARKSSEKSIHYVYFVPPSRKRFHPQVQQWPPHRYAHSLLSRTCEFVTISEIRVASSFCLTALRMGCRTLYSVDCCYEIHPCVVDVQGSRAILVSRCVSSW